MAWITTVQTWNTENEDKFMKALYQVLDRITCDPVRLFLSTL